MREKVGQSVDTSLGNAKCSELSIILFNEIVGDSARAIIDGTSTIYHSSFVARK